MPHPRLFAVAAVCAGFYLAAQTLQHVLRLTVLPPPATPEAEALMRMLPAETLRAVVLLLSFFALIPIYVAVALDRFRAAPGAAVCGAIFGTMFVLLEISYRTIDLFVVSGVWAHAGELGRLSLWDQAVNGWYLILLLSYFLSSVCFALAFRRDATRWDLLAFFSFTLNALPVLGRILGGYAGVGWLATLSGPLYFPAVVVVMTLLVVWLVGRARPERKLASPDVGGDTSADGPRAP